MSKLSIPIATAVALSSIALPAAAQEAAGAAAGGSVSLSPGDASADGNASAEGKKGKKKKKRDKGDSGDEPWIKRHRPTAMQMEAGIYGGIMLPAQDHELYNPNAATWQSYKKIAPDIGLRFGFYPLSFLGIEVEGGVAPTKVADGSSSALLGMFRGYGIVQLPYRIAPFGLFGIGAASKKCEAEFGAGAHMCTVFELFDSVSTNVIKQATAIPASWVYMEGWNTPVANPSNPGEGLNENCASYNYDTADQKWQGMQFTWATTALNNVDKALHFKNVACNATLPISCCK